MSGKYTVGDVFLQYNGKTIRHMDRNPGVETEFWYVESGTGDEFDVRSIPLGEKGVDLIKKIEDGDREAHREAIKTAIDAGVYFSSMSYLGNGVQSSRPA